MAWLLGIELIERHCIVMAVAGCQQLRAGTKSLPLLGSYVSSVLTAQSVTRLRCETLLAPRETKVLDTSSSWQVE